MTHPLRIGIAGLGTVGQSTASLIVSQAELIAQRSGMKVVIAAVSARDKNKQRPIDTGKFLWLDDPLALSAHKDVDVVVELIGGAEGMARSVVETALEHGKHVVTANKALVAAHGVKLAALAERKGVVLAFEAAVAGGIPVLKALRQGLAANSVSRVAGILNGTCNYILTHMWHDRRGFDDMLKEAQKLGFAEADPSFDVDGIDTAHKLAILASLAFGVAPDISAIHVEGIRAITLADMHHADELGYVIKLLGIAEKNASGISQRVHPCLVEKSSALAGVQGVFNAVQIEGDAAGTIFLQGRGAGGMPTASAVVADIIDIARKTAGASFGIPSSSIMAANTLPSHQLQTSYYVRLSVIDKPGVLAEVTGVFRDAGISLKSFLQHGHAPGEQVSLVIATHQTQASDMEKALRLIAKQQAITKPPLSIRIESL